MEKDFLASTNHFFLYVFPETPARERFFLSSGNLFLNESFILAVGEGFFSLMETVTLLESFFLLAETVTAIFWLVETILFHWLIYFSRSPSSHLAETYFSVEKNSIDFYSEFSFLLVKTII